MSSNFTVKRICEHCGEVFEAKTTVTRFCSSLCNKRNYKLREREVKMAPMDKVVQTLLNKPVEELKSSEFLSVKNAAKLLGSSERIIHSLINNGTLNAINLSKRKTIIYRKDIDKLFELKGPKEKIKIQPKVKDCYHMAEAQEKFNISERALFQIIKRNNIPKFQEGWYTYVAKTALDNIFNPKNVQSCQK